MATEGYPYTPVPGRLEELLGKLHGMGKPATADQAWMKQQGYTSGNDMMSLAAMRKLGMIGSDKKPTAFFEAFRNRDRKGVADGVRKAYRELFELYPDAHRKDAEALQAFFRSKSSAGDKVQKLTVRTFQTLCKFGDFDTGAAPAQTPKQDAKNGAEEAELHTQPGSPGGVTLNVNIQLELPPSAEGEVYDKLFEAMGKHLKGLVNLE